MKFEWNQECFDKLKSLLIESPIFSYPQSDGQFILDTDASNFGIGVVLSQVQDGEEKVIAYASKTLSNSQSRYCTTYKELLAVVTFIKHFRHYLWGRNFMVRTDHVSLLWLKNFKDPEGMLAKWLATFDTYDITFQHRRGNLHANADGLSRKPYNRCKRDDCCCKASDEIDLSQESANCSNTDSKGSETNCIAPLDF